MWAYAGEWLLLQVEKGFCEHCAIQMNAFLKTVACHIAALTPRM